MWVQSKNCEMWPTWFKFFVGGSDVKDSEMRPTKGLRVGAFNEGVIASF